MSSVISLSLGDNCCALRAGQIHSLSQQNKKRLSHKRAKTSASPPSRLRCHRPLKESTKEPLLYIFPWIQSNYLSSIKINNSWLGWCGQRSPLAFASQSMWTGHGRRGGLDPSIGVSTGKLHPPQSGLKSQGLNKEMKRNLRKMDESPG